MEEGIVTMQFRDSHHSLFPSLNSVTLRHAHTHRSVLMAALDQDEHTENMEETTK